MIFFFPQSDMLLWCAHSLTFLAAFALASRKQWITGLQHAGVLRVLQVLPLAKAIGSTPPGASVRLVSLLLNETATKVEELELLRARKRMRL